MRPIGKLKALTVAREKRPGMYGDGGGLCLQVTGSRRPKLDIPVLGARARCRHRRARPRSGNRQDPRHRARNGTRKSYHVVSLEDARRRALECRQLRERGLDPIEARDDAKVRAVLEQAKAVKFADAATAYIAAHRAGWRSDRHVAQWTQTLCTYAFPVFGDVSVQAIDTALVMKCLEPIWSIGRKPPLGCAAVIECVLDWARVRGYRAGENPARWSGHLEHLLPARRRRSCGRAPCRYAYGDVPAFLAICASKRTSPHVPSNF